VIAFELPQSTEVLAAIGRVAVRHGQLEYCLRMTLKSVVGSSVAEALDATEGSTASEVRKRVRALARKRLGEGPAMVKLDALLNRAARATERRNELLHGLWAIDAEGPEVLRHRGHVFAEIPAVADLEEAAEEIKHVAFELNGARLQGFLKEALDAKSWTPRVQERPADHA
jgi:hypothetical protein